MLDLESGELQPLLAVGMAESAAQRQLFAKPEGNGVTGFVAATGKSYVCEHTVEDWMKIPGIPQALQDLLGQQGVDYFHTSIADYLETHNTAAKQLFQNWLDIVFQTFEEPQQ